MAVDDGFDAIMGALAAPMIVVTVAAGDERDGCLVGFHCQSSIDPLRYTVWLARANRTCALALHAEHLGLHFLAAHQDDLAARFGSVSGDDADKFDGLDVEAGPGGTPVIRSIDHRILAEVVSVFREDGDHVCFTLAPVSATADGDLAPLRYPEVADLEPGHPPDDPEHL